MISGIDSVLRRIKPEKRGAYELRSNGRSLEYLSNVAELPPKIMYDTTVYIDALAQRFPPGLRQLASSKPVWHCSVAATEVSYPCGRLNPAHPGTSAAIDKIKQVLNEIPMRRLISPDTGIWLEAGVLSGTMDRIQGQPAGSTLNDALIFLTALKHGCTVLTRNIRDFDLLQQIVPEGRVLFYERTE